VKIAWNSHQPIILHCAPNIIKDRSLLNLLSFIYFRQHITHLNKISCFKWNVPGYTKYPTWTKGDTIVCQLTLLYILLPVWLSLYVHPVRQYQSHAYASVFLQYTACNNPMAVSHACFDFSVKWVSSLTTCSRQLSWQISSSCLHCSCSVPYFCKVFH
jgi:hypothetical protein